MAGNARRLELVSAERKRLVAPDDEYTSAMPAARGRIRNAHGWRSRSGSCAGRRLARAGRRCPADRARRAFDRAGQPPCLAVDAPGRGCARGQRLRNCDPARNEPCPAAEIPRAAELGPFWLIQAQAYKWQGNYAEKQLRAGGDDPRATPWRDVGRRSQELMQASSRAERGDVVLDLARELGTVLADDGVPGAVIAAAAQASSCLATFGLHNLAQDLLEACKVERAVNVHPEACAAAHRKRTRGARAGRPIRVHAAVHGPLRRWSSAATCGLAASCAARLASPCASWVASPRRGVPRGAGHRRQTISSVTAGVNESRVGPGPGGKPSTRARRRAPGRRSRVRDTCISSGQRPHLLGSDLERARRSVERRSTSRPGDRCALQASLCDMPGSPRADRSRTRHGRTSLVRCTRMITMPRSAAEEGEALLRKAVFAETLFATGEHEGHRHALQRARERPRSARP